jgi:Asp-tRNA(Asn)/Glu-tRNA(Gln) amidotransferase A subunit family amidase
MSSALGAIDAVAGVRTALERVDPQNAAFIPLDADGALARAASDPAGDLRGVVLAVKDLIDTRGLRTTYGTSVHAEHVPGASAACVEALEARGAIVIGKANLNEYAYGVSGYNPHWGQMRVPGAPDRTPGGSSGGSAVAVAEGSCDLALGTDTSGSARIPAACCGVLGFKLAHDPAAMRGVRALAPSLDALGYLARDVETLRRVLRLPALDGPPARVAALEELALPPLPFEHHWTLFRAEAYREHRDEVLAAPERYGADLRLKVSQPLGDADAARAAMAAWRERFAAALGDVELLVGPVFAGPPPTVEELARDYRAGTLTASDRLMTHTPLANALGWPALALPTADGPRHLLGRPGSEAAMLAYADRHMEDSR